MNRRLRALCDLAVSGVRDNAGLQEYDGRIQDLPLGVGQVGAVPAARQRHSMLLKGAGTAEAPQPTAFSDTLYVVASA